MGPTAHPVGALGCPRLVEGILRLMVRAIISEFSVVYCFMGRGGTAEGSESTEKIQIDPREGRPG